MRGLVLMLLSFLIFSAVDAQAKYLTMTLHPLQVVWIRQTGLLVAVFVLLGIRGRQILATGHLKLQIGRGALAGLSGACFITGVASVPLADAVAISFVAPFIVTVLGSLVLRETVGPHRWGAVILGFAGTLIVIRPGFGSFHPAMLFVVAAACCFAVRQIVSRALASSDRTVTTVAYTALTASAVLTIPMLIVWETPATSTEIVLLICIAIMAGIGEFCLIKALEVGQAAVLAPTQYTLIIWGTFYGWLIFDQFPDGWTWIGTAIIIASGLYTVHRERIAVARRQKGQT